MLSSVSKLADKYFIVGFFLPALLFSVALLKIFDCPSWAASVCTPTASVGTAISDISFAVLFVWTLAVFLTTINYYLYRFFEGYSIVHKRLPFLRVRYQRDFQNLSNRYKNLRTADRKSEASKLKARMLQIYPTAVDEVMPTAFGNRIRAFEVYPRQIYGADSITIWPRLASIIPKDFGAQISDARSQVDFFVNGCTLASFIALLFFGDAISLSIRSGGVTSSAWAQFGFGALAVATSIVSYICAVGRVVAWGDLVKSAFDCFLPQLAKQLGYALPAAESKRKTFWGAVSRQMIFGKLIADGRFVTIEAGSESPHAGSKSAETGENPGESTDDEDEDAAKPGGDEAGHDTVRSNKQV